MKRIRAHLTGSLQVSISAYRKDAGTWKSTTRNHGDKSLHIGIGGNDMTIDEAIECERNHRLYPKYHEQIADWLEELKDYRDKNKMVVRVDVENMDSIKDEIDELSKYAGSQYNKAIDDFVKEICKMIVQSENNGNYRFYAVEIKQAIAELAEQLKVGVNNETYSQQRNHDKGSYSRG